VGLARQSESPEAKLRRLKLSTTESEVYSGCRESQQTLRKHSLYLRHFKKMDTIRFIEIPYFNKIVEAKENF